MQRAAKEEVRYPAGEMRFEQRPDDCHVVNLSFELSAPQLQALSQGLNFAPSPQSFPWLTSWLELKPPLPEQEQPRNRPLMPVGVVGALSCVKPPPSNTLPGELRAVRQMASDKNIVVLPADTRVSDCSDEPK